MPKPPGTEAELPRATGKKRSSTRWPVTSGAEARSRSRNGRARRTGQRRASAICSSPMAATGSSTPYVARRRQPRQPAGDAGRDEEAVLERLRLGHDPEQASGRDLGPLPRGRGEDELPLARERGRPLAGPEEVLRAGQPAEHPVEHPAEQAGPQLGGQRPAARDGLLPRLQPARVLVDLDRGQPVLERDDLPREPRGPHLDEVEHGRTLHAAHLDNGAVDPNHGAAGHRQSSSSRTPRPSMQRSARAGRVKSTLRRPARAVTPPAGGWSSTAASSPSASAASVASRSRSAW